MLCRFCQIFDFTKSTFWMLILQNRHVDFVKYIYTIKTRLKYIYIYMFIFSELIEETGRPPGLIFGMWGYFWPGSDKFEFWKNFTHLTEL